MMLGTPAGVPLRLQASPGRGLVDTPSTSPFSSTPSLSHMQLYRSPFEHPIELGTVAVTSAPTPVISLADRCLDSFYHHFFSAHPFVLPKEYFLRLIKEQSLNVEPLLAAMRYVGALFVDTGPARAVFLDEAVRLAYLPTCPQDGFLVQTLQLLIVGLEGS